VFNFAGCLAGIAAAGFMNAPSSHKTWKGKQDNHRAWSLKFLFFVAHSLIHANANQSHKQTKSTQKQHNGE
jgi:hypothetical protein